MADSSEQDPVDRQLFWMNLVGISVVTILLGTFGWFYGTDLLSFIAFLFGQPDWP